MNLSFDQATQQIETSFAKIQATLEKRKNNLLSEAEVIRFRKEKELKIQKDSLEAMAEGMRTSTTFTKTLIESGTQVEIATSQKDLLTRLSTLSLAKIDLIPCHDATLRYSEDHLASLTKAIEEFGGVSGNLADPTNSYLERGTSSPAVKLNEQVKFTITSVNQEGKKIGRGGDTFIVNVQGPSEVKVSRAIDFSRCCGELKNFFFFFLLIDLGR